MIRPLIEGFALTFKHLFRRPITVNYPDQKMPMFPRYRGKQVLMRDENGLEKCVACGLCAVACPADAIYLEAAENDGTVHGRPPLRVGLPDSQDALHLLRLLRRGLPGLGDLHGQGLRAGGLQQGRLRVGQDRAARPGGAPAALRPRPSGSAAHGPWPRPPFLDALRTSACSSATARWARCSTARASSSTAASSRSTCRSPTSSSTCTSEYLRAGADVIETNTFGANRMKLRGFGLGDQVQRDQSGRRRGWRASAVARRRAEAYVAGAIGPLGVRVEPWGKTGVDEAEAMFREQAQALLDGGVDLFILETFRDLNEIGAAIAAVRSVCDLPIVAQMTTEEDGNSLDGTPPEQFAPALLARGADVVGVNCSVGPGADARDDRAHVRQSYDVPLSAQPNAGKPRDIEGRNIYLCSPEYMASYARRFIAAGVRLVGGCCGTTPEHIRQIALAVEVDGARRWRARCAVGATSAIAVASQPHAQAAGAARSRSRGWRASWRPAGSSRGVELVPPRGHDADRARCGGAARSRERGVDVVTIPDGPRARRAHERAVARGADPAAGRHRDAAPVLLPRSQPAGHPVGPARRARDGRAQPARHHRRRAQPRRLSRMPPRCSTSIRSGSPT